MWNSFDLWWILKRSISEVAIVLTSFNFQQFSFWWFLTMLVVICIPVRSVHIFLWSAQITSDGQGDGMVQWSSVATLDDTVVNARHWAWGKWDQQVSRAAINDVMSVGCCDGSAYKKSRGELKSSLSSNFLTGNPTIKKPLCVCWAGVRNRAWQNSRLVLQDAQHRRTRWKHQRSRYFRPC